MTKSLSVPVFRTATRTLLLLLSTSAFAQDYNVQPAAEELAKLGLEGTELTPAGAIRAGNAEGTIPAWKNEMLRAPAGWQSGTYHADPFAEDEVLFTITAANYKEHTDKLSPGQMKMFEVYPDYFMNIYPTRRSAVFKPFIYQAALENAGRARIVMSDTYPNLIGFEGAVKAWAFPIPQNGPQAAINQATRPFTPWSSHISNTTPVTSTGDYQTVKLAVQYHASWGVEENTLDNYDPTEPGAGGFYYYQTTIAPATTTPMAISF